MLTGPRGRQIERGPSGRASPESKRDMKLRLRRVEIGRESALQCDRSLTGTGRLEHAETDKEQDCYD